MTSGVRIPSWGWPAAGALAGGVLLSLAFPPFEKPEFVWVGLVPLLMVARVRSPADSFRWGFAGGLVFWLINMAWLLNLGRTGTVWPMAGLGWIGLAGYGALYVGAFLAMVAFLWQGGRRPPGYDSARPASETDDDASDDPDTTAASAIKDNVWRNLQLILVAPLLWVGLEYIRYHLMTGFAWNALGVSQYRNLLMIQLAEWGGVYAVSAPIVALNMAVAATAMRFVALYRYGQGTRRVSVELMLALAMILAGWWIGVSAIRRIQDEAPEATEVRVAVVQPNIAQEKKWTQEAMDEIYASLTLQTECALANRGVHLIVWPETAVPGMARDDEEVRAFVRALVERGVPILVGSLDEAWIAGKQRLYNASMLFGTDGEILQEYRKIHLVPFGEYIPFDKTIRLIEQLAPLGFSCMPGSEFTVFTIPGAGARFGVLICLEDAFSDLAREEVLAGARLLVNQTNDAWFDGTCGARQHLAQSVFRCVENRVPAIRCANTGISCAIDKLGRMDLLEGEAGEVRIASTKPWDVTVEGPEMPLTFYTRYGDRPFAIPCAVLAVAVFVLALRAWKREKTAIRGPGNTAA